MPRSNDDWQGKTEVLRDKSAPRFHSVKPLFHCLSFVTRIIWLGWHAPVFIRKTVQRVLEFYTYSYKFDVFICWIL